MPLTLVFDIKSLDRGIITSSQDILEEFFTYYSKLYASSLPPDLGRLHHMLHTFLDSDQTGFMLPKSTDINVHRLFVNIHVRHVIAGTTGVASFEKAFDTVEWTYLWELL